MSGIWKPSFHLQVKSWANGKISYCSCICLRSRPQGKLLLLKLERLADECGGSEFIGAETSVGTRTVTGKLKILWINCWRVSVGKCELKTTEGQSQKSAHTLWSVTLETQLDFHNKYEGGKNPPYALTGGGKRKSFEMFQSCLFWKCLPLT